MGFAEIRKKLVLLMLYLFKTLKIVSFLYIIMAFFLIDILVIFDLAPSLSINGYSDKESAAYICWYADKSEHLFYSYDCEFLPFKWAIGHFYLTYLTTITLPLVMGLAASASSIVGVISGFLEILGLILVLWGPIFLSFIFLKDLLGFFAKKTVYIKRILNDKNQ